MKQNSSYSSKPDDISDYISFICSRDIREYLYEINYRITDFQAFFLIDSCTHINYEEKLNALKQLYARCEDFVIHTDSSDKRCTFKNLLAEVINGREKSLPDFENNSNRSFIYAVYGRFNVCNRPTDHFYRIIGYFTSVDAALSEPSFEDCDYIRIEKLHVGVIPEKTSIEVAVAYYSMDRNLLEIDDNQRDYASYQDYCIFLPLPFHKGDIVCHTDNYREEDNRGSYIYDSCSLKDSSDIRYGYDFSDNVLLLYDISSGYPFVDSHFNIFDYEYSRVPLEGDEQNSRRSACFLKESPVSEKQLSVLISLTAI
ncbi:MAG: hypothetical protein J6M07_02550 [Ruminococcus sp.]|nr:hypothetical protein [Ruminococcus sp.]